ncbi:MAG: transposase domain-containing protein [Planctomycetes bacterium]|nr:transposase domain-containing protein [Planctomycetota bacterium]
MVEAALRGKLTEAQARRLANENPEVLALALLAASQRIAEWQGQSHGQHPSPSTPSGMVPLSTKPNTPKRRKKPGAKKGHSGHRRKTPERIDERETHRLKRCPCCGGHCNGVSTNARVPSKTFPKRSSRSSPIIWKSCFVWDAYLASRPGRADEIPIPGGNDAEYRLGYEGRTADFEVVGELRINAISVPAGQRAADFITLVSSAWRNDLDVWAYIKDVLDRLLAGETDYAALRPDSWRQTHPEAIREYRVTERRDRADRKQYRRAARRRNTPKPTH